MCRVMHLHQYYIFPYRSSKPMQQLFASVPVEEDVGHPASNSDEENVPPSGVEGDAKMITDEDADTAMAVEHQQQPQQTKNDDENPFAV